MAEFHETIYGKRYYEYQLPELIKLLGRVVVALEKPKGVVDPQYLLPSDKVTCSRCNGSGMGEDYLATVRDSPKVTCIYCNGTGVTRLDEMPGYQKS